MPVVGGPNGDVVTGRKRTADEAELGDESDKKKVKSAVSASDNMDVIVLDDDEAGAGQIDLT